ncbi:jg12315 [Pararge aegeria aegeria]|uniref:Jg12315 protein n=1 Tax=Pararge aegeria aegeria TaxID=348720 RepID=A0A8S4QLU1_9NEOP|nr:jg12315 [Pararge aegeria aegeria]
MPRTTSSQISKVLASAASDSDRSDVVSEELNSQHLPRTQRKRRRSNEIEFQLNDFRAEIKFMMDTFMEKQNKRLETLENHIMEVKQQNVAIQSSNQDIEQSLKFMSDEIRSLQGKIGSIEKDRKNLSLHLMRLEDKIDDIDKRTIKTCVEIRNVPKQSRETKDMLYLYVDSLSKCITKSEINKVEVRDVYRLPSKKSDAKCSTIIVEFSNTLYKNHILNAAKKFNREYSEKLNTLNLGLPGTRQPIYISEQLTAKTKRLLFLARDFAKSAQFAHCWTTNGNVYLRKKEGTPYIFVKNEERLSDIIKKNINEK